VAWSEEGTVYSCGESSVKNIIITFPFLNPMKYLLALVIFFQLHANAQKPFAVVELFTSEGCSSCPAADNLLTTIATDAAKSDQNIITLSYHVDYWNRLGWKDPYSKYQYTIRQENYSRVLPGKEVFTPQAVVNGKSSCIGSRKDELKEKINEELLLKPKVALTLNKDSIVNDTLYISYTMSAEDPDFVLRLALTEDDLSSVVSKGENSGKTLKHTSVVRTFFSVDKPVKNGNELLPVKVFSGKGRKHLIAFVQRKKTMQIVAAESMQLQ
jgi:hypothetical protein